MRSCATSRIGVEGKGERGFALLDPHGYTGIGVRDEPRLLNEPGVSDSFPIASRRKTIYGAGASRLPTGNSSSYASQVVSFNLTKFFLVFSYRN